MRLLLIVSAICCAISTSVGAKTVVFWQNGFPNIEDQAVERHTLERAIANEQPVFYDLDQLLQPHALEGAQLLVFPYGSAFPSDAWPAIMEYLRGGGNLLVIGGRPFRVPVNRVDGKFVSAQASSAYQREIGIVHTYEVPQKGDAKFVWRDGYSFLPALEIQGSRFFVLQGQINGLGYMLNAAADRIAAPVVVSDHTALNGSGFLGGRWVFLDFTPAAGYWNSGSGATLLQAAANYAVEGATLFSVDVEFSTLRPGEVPEANVHLRNAWKQRHDLPQTGAIGLELRRDSKVLGVKQIPCSGETVDVSTSFERPLAPGFYTLRATYFENSRPREFYENGFWVEDESALASGPSLGVSGDFLTKNKRPFFPVGANYFSTEEDGWDFSGPRNAEVWQRDFSDMARHHVSLVRTGVWGGQMKFIEQGYGGVTERFLRNVEAFLLCAHQYHIAVNFTFFAFDPQTILRVHESEPVVRLPGRNPYLDPVTVRAEQEYVLSIVSRFKNIPDLSWDLINEPSFSNPAELWKGNTPSEDPSELAAWHEWLKQRYGSIQTLAENWHVTPEQIKNFDAVSLPSHHDLMLDFEHGDAGQTRALDFNLFAQDMFSEWVRQMVHAIRAAGSNQLIDIGQDEGGVTNRLLNQFYAHADISFTTNHTYRENDALLWDSLAAKAPGTPNIIGETGFQPVILPDGAWQFDEIEALGLLERKWTYGFAGGSSGVLPWDWDREVYFGLKRSDGSNKVWVDMLSRIGEFAERAGPYATALVSPDIAIVLPQSLQLSVLGPYSIQAQQNAVRALYGYARASAYCIGEYQIAQIGNPKLIIVPSPWVLSDQAWNAILERVRRGATLLISGRFDLKPHFLPARERMTEAGISYRPGRLDLFHDLIAWPGATAELAFDREETNFLERGFLPGGKTFAEHSIGAGTILFLALPLELNQNVAATGALYRYAIQQAKISPVYTTSVADPGILIVPSCFPHATLYVITSQTDSQHVSFRDMRSGKEFSSDLDSGRAALVLIGEDGNILASYNWAQRD
jgi:hypothetical protein